MSQKPTNVNAYRTEHEQAEVALRAAAHELVKTRLKLVELGESSDFTPLDELMPEEPEYGTTDESEGEESEGEESSEDDPATTETSGFGRRKR